MNNTKPEVRVNLIQTNLIINRLGNLSIKNNKKKIILQLNQVQVPMLLNHPILFLTKHSKKKMKSQCLKRNKNCLVELIDFCLKKNLKICHWPIVLAQVKQTK